MAPCYATNADGKGWLMVRWDAASSTFCQTTPGDWAPVVAEVERALGAK